MTKSIKVISAFAVLSFGLLVGANQAHADMVSPPGILPGISFRESVLIIGAGVIVGFTALVSWLVISAIRKKKDVINK